jgi:hypothetical protein
MDATWGRRVAVRHSPAPTSGRTMGWEVSDEPLPEAEAKRTVDLYFRPAAPPPLADDPEAGWDRARDLARWYLRNSVELLAAVAWRRRYSGARPDRGGGRRDWRRLASCARAPSAWVIAAEPSRAFRWT